MNILICVGSSCHLKMSRDLVEIFKKMIDSNKLSDKITIKGSFCMGRCGESGVCVKLDNEQYSVNISDAKDFFNTHVLNKV